MKKLKKIFTLAVLGIVVFSCNNDLEKFESSVPVPATANLVETVKRIPSLSTLVEAVVKAELETELTSETYTILAPTNAAFSAFFKSKGYGDIKFVPASVLKSYLLNHVIIGNITSSDLMKSEGGTGYANTIAPGPGNNPLSLYYNTNNGVMFNGEATVTTADIKATNGTVHVINSVLEFPTVATFVKTDPTYSSLLAALTRDGDGLINVLSSGGPLTVFAPINSAFTNLLSEEGIEVGDLSQLPDSFLYETLVSHVSNGNVLSKDITDGLVINTVSSAKLTAKITDGAVTLTDPQERVSNVVAPIDIQAINGAIHTIDKVVINKYPIITLK